MLLRSDSKFPRKTTSIADAAQFYVEFGLTPVPIPHGSKGPKIKGWQQLTSDSNRDVLRQFKRHEGNLGLVCGVEGGIAVVDIDVKNNAPGLHNWRALVDEHEYFEPLISARTPSGGYHLFFSGDSLPFKSNTSQIAEGIDLRAGTADGEGIGQVVVAPSSFAGKAYRWLDKPDDYFLPNSIDDLPEAPDWLAYLACFKPDERERLERDSTLSQRVMKAPRRKWRVIFEAARGQDAIRRLTRNTYSDALEHPYVQSAIDGECERITQCRRDQNATLNKASFRVGSVLAGATACEWGDEIVDEVSAKLLKAAMAMPNLDTAYPWTSSEGQATAAKTIRSGLSSGLKSPADLPELKQVHSKGSSVVGGSEDGSEPTPPTALRLKPLSEIQAHNPEWLWKDRIALGTLCLIAGDPGQGKSQLTCLIASRLTRGKAILNDDRSTSKPCSVLMLNCEDSAGNTIKGRVLAAGGDTERVFVLDTSLDFDASGKPINHIGAFDADLRQVDKLLADNPNIRLVTVDPISAYMGKADGNNNSDVRRVLGGLAALAEKHHVAFLCISHLNKGGNAEKAHQRVSGSGAFVAAARSAFVVAPKPDCETDQNEAPTEYVLVQVKNNLAKKVPALAYKIIDAEVTDRQTEIQTSCIKWTKQVHDLTAEEALSGRKSGTDQRSQIEVAALWLSNLLAKGAKSAGKVRRLADKADLKWRTIQRAAEKLNVKRQKTGMGDGWSWSLS